MAMSSSRGGHKKFMTTPPSAPCSRPSHFFCSGTSCRHPPEYGSDAALSFALTGAFGKTMTEIKANEVLLACSIGDLAWLKKGLAHGSCPNATNREGLTGLHIAARDGHYECLKYMLNNCGVNINALSKVDRVTPLHCSVMQKNGSAMHQCMKILLDRGADHALKDIHGQTVLHYAAKSGNINCLKFLLESGVDIHAKDNSGKTAYEIACISNNYELVRLLSSLHWAHKKDEAQNEKLRADQDIQKTEADRKELLARRRAENAEFAFLHWLEVKDFKSLKGPPQECSKRSRSASLPYGRLSPCGTCLKTSPLSTASTSSEPPRYKKISVPTKVCHHQEKKNLESIGKPSKMHPYTNYPPKSVKKRVGGGGGSKVAKSRSGKSSRRASSSKSTSSKTTSSVAKKRPKKSREDAKTSDQDITSKSWSVRTLMDEVATADRPEHEQEDIREDANSKTEQAITHRNSVAASKSDDDRNAIRLEDDRNAVTATKLEDDQSETDCSDSDSDNDGLDFSRLNDNGFNRWNNSTNNENGLAHPQFDFNFEDDDETETALFHDVGDLNDLASLSLSLPAVLTKDKTPAEILQLLRHLGSSGGNGKRNYRRRHSLSLGGKQFSSSSRHFSRRLSLGSIPEGKIVLDYADEEEQVSDIDSQLLRDIESSIKGVEVYEGDAPVEELTPSHSPTEHTDDELQEGAQAVNSTPALPESGVETEAKLTPSKPSSPPKTLKIVNLAWDESSNSVQSHLSTTSFSSTSKKISPKLQSPQSSNSRMATNPPSLIITSPLANKDTASQKIFPPSKSKMAGPPSHRATPSPLPPSRREHRTPTYKLTPSAKESFTLQTLATGDKRRKERPPTPAVGSRTPSTLLHLQTVKPSLSDPCLAGKTSQSPQNSLSLHPQDGERRASYPLAFTEGNCTDDGKLQKNSLFSSSSTELSKSMIMSSNESISSDTLEGHHHHSAPKLHHQQTNQVLRKVTPPSRKLTPPSYKVTPPSAQYSPLRSSASCDKIATLRPPMAGVRERKVSPLQQQAIYFSSSDPTLACKVVVAPPIRNRSVSSSSQSDEIETSKRMFFIGEAEEFSADENSSSSPGLDKEKHSLFSSSASQLSKSMLLSSNEPLAEEQTVNQRSSSSPGLAKENSLFSSSALQLSKSMLLSSSEPSTKAAEEQTVQQRSSSSPGLVKKQSIRTSLFQYDGSLK